MKDELLDKKNPFGDAKFQKIKFYIKINNKK